MLIEQKNNNEKVSYGLTKLLYTIKDTAQILSMSEKSVRRLLERGLLKASPALRIKLITRESIPVASRENDTVELSQLLIRCLTAK